MQSSDKPIFEELSHTVGPKRVLLIRHCDSVWTAGTKNGGKGISRAQIRVMTESGCNILNIPNASLPLTEHGEIQAQNIGRKISAMSLQEQWSLEEAAKYRSLTERTRMTWQKLLQGYCEIRRLFEEKHHKNPQLIAEGVIAENNIAERNFGPLERMADEDIDEKYPTLRAEQAGNPFFFRPPNGQSMQDLGIQQVRPWLVRIMEEHVDQTVVAVTHGGTIQTAKAILESWTPEQANKFLQPSPPVGSITTLVFSPEKRRLVVQNCTPLDI